MKIKPIVSITRAILISASRDLLFIGIGVLLIVVSAISYFLGTTALSEEDQMSLVYMGGSCRFVLAVGVILFITSHIRRAFDNKEIEQILSRPISRNAIILSYMIGFAILVILLIIPVFLAFAIFFHHNIFAMFLWFLGILFENLILVSFTTFAALLLSSSVSSAMAGLAFYFLSRMMGFFLASTHEFYLPDSVGAIGKWLMENILKIISSVLPRFDLYGKTSLLVYGNISMVDFRIMVLQTLIYIPFIIMLALYDFRKKQF